MLGQQMADNRESLLDNLIRQLQNEQDVLQIAEPEAVEAEGIFFISHFIGKQGFCVMFLVVSTSIVYILVF